MLRQVPPPATGAFGRVPSGRRAHLPTPSLAPPARVIVAQSAGGAVAPVVSDANVPEGHASLHSSLYGAGGAEEAHAAAGYNLRQDEDDGTQVVPLQPWLDGREGEKPLGVYGIYDDQQQLQYIGYSRNVVTALRGHLARVGPQRARSVRVMVFANRAMATREHLEREVLGWVQRFSGGQLPPGNGPDKEMWEGVQRVLTAAEQAEHADKAAKLKRAMGHVKAEGTSTDTAAPEQIRHEWKQAMEAGDWSAVIDGQTSEALGGAPGTSQAAAAAASVGGASAAAAAGVLGTSGPAMSPFAQPTVHRKIGEGPPSSGGNGDGGKGGPSIGVPREMTVQSVDCVLNEVRPYLVADGGDVEVAEVSAGRVFLRLQGTCSTCASQSATMKMGIERALKAAFGDALIEVVQLHKVDVVSATVDNVDRHLDMLRGAISSFGGRVEVSEVQGSKAVVKYKGPPAIGKGVSAAIRERFPELREVVLTDFAST